MSWRVAEWGVAQPRGPDRPARWNALAEGGDSPRDFGFIAIGHKLNEEWLTLLGSDLSRSFQPPTHLALSILHATGDIMMSPCLPPGLSMSRRWATIEVTVSPASTDAPILLREVSRSCMTLCRPSCPGWRGIVACRVVVSSGRSIIGGECEGERWLSVTRGRFAHRAVLVFRELV